MITQWTVYFWVNGDKCCREVNRKRVYAESELMARLIAAAIAVHDKDEWGVDIAYDFCDASEVVGSEVLR